MVFDVGKAAARGARGGAARSAPSVEILKTLGSRPAMERIEELRRLYGGAGGIDIAGVGSARAWGPLLEKHRGVLASAYGVTSRAQLMARVVGGLSDGTSSFSLSSSPFLPNLRPSPFVPSFSSGGQGVSRYHAAAYPMAHQFANAMDVAGPSRVSGLHGSIASSLYDVGFGPGTPYPYGDWHLKGIRAARDQAIQALLKRVQAFGPKVITPERQAKEETGYHPDLRSWDVPDTTQDPEDLWAEGVARGIARHYQAPVLLSKVRGGQRWMIRVAKRHAGASLTVAGMAGGAAVGAFNGEVVLEMVRGGVAGYSGYLAYILMHD